MLYASQEVSLSYPPRTLCQRYALIPALKFVMSSDAFSSGDKLFHVEMHLGKKTTSKHVLYWILNNRTIDSKGTAIYTRR